MVDNKENKETNKNFDDMFDDMMYDEDMIIKTLDSLSNEKERDDFRTYIQLFEKIQKSMGKPVVDNINNIFNFADSLFPNMKGDKFAQNLKLSLGTVLGMFIITNMDGFTWENFEKSLPMYKSQFENMTKNHDKDYKRGEN